MDLVYNTWERASRARSTIFAQWAKWDRGGSPVQQKAGDRVTELLSCLRKETVQTKPLLCSGGCLSCSFNCYNIYSLGIAFYQMWHLAQLWNSPDSTHTFWFTPACLRFYGSLWHGWMTALATCSVTGRTLEIHFLESFEALCCMQVTNKECQVTC